MRLLKRLKSYFRNLWHRSVAESDLGEELRGYVDELTERKIREGMDAAAARRSALVEIGGLERLKESTRSERAGFGFEVNVWKTLQVALRRLWHAPGFTMVAVLTLALAIGANAAIFSIADYVLFRPLPYEDPDRVHLLVLENRRSGKQFTMTPYQHLQLIGESHRGLSEVGFLQPRSPVLATANGETESIGTVAVSANYFDVLGVRAHRGRLFTAEDAAQSGRAVVMTYEGWVKRFAGDPGVIGKTVQLGSVDFDLLGVLPPGFVYPSAFARNASLLQVMAPLRPGEEGGALHPIVRREPGVSKEQAQAEIEALVAGLGSADSQKGEAYPALVDVKEILYPVGRRMMGFLLAASGLVLLIGCANLGIMLLVRGQRRVKETGVRAALGASRIQLVLPIFFEASLIGMAGAALAVAITSLTFKLLLLQVPPAAYGNLAVGVDLRVALYALALGLAGGMVFAVAPAWRSAKLDVQALIQGRDERVLQRGRLGRPLVALQAALAVMLIAGAVRVGYAFFEALNEPLGFDQENVILADFVPKDGRSGYARVIEALARRPDVVSAGASYKLPLDSFMPYAPLAKDGIEVRGAGVALVLPGYFETARIPLIGGRFQNWEDVRGTGEAAVIPESVARLVFGERNPLGQIFEVPEGPTFRVVGVVSDTIATPGMRAVAYVLPWNQKTPLKLVVRTRDGGAATLADIKREIAVLAPGVPVTAQWWTDSLDALPKYRNPRFQTLVLGTFGGLALVLTALGIFGVTAFAVGVRLKEMGIRIALGAKGGSLVGMMVWQVLGPVGLGLIVGLVAMRWAGKLAETQAGLIAGPSPGWVLVVAVGTVLLASLAAAYLPARRASRVDPVVVLRSE